MSEREAAAARGEKTYQGNPCRRGHSGTRYVLNNECTECARIGAVRRRERLHELLRQARAGEEASDA